MTGDGPSGGGGEEGLSGRAAVGYDHGHDGEVLYVGLALDPAHVEGFVESCLERIGGDDAEGEDLLRSEWGEGKRDLVLEVLKAEVEVGAGRPAGWTPTTARRYTRGLWWEGVRGPLGSRQERPIR